MQERSLTHTKQVDPLFTVGLAIIDPFDREWVAHRRRALLEVTPWRRQFSATFASSHSRGSSSI
jgi:hypothetical protein